MEISCCGIQENKEAQEIDIWVKEIIAMMANKNLEKR